LEGNKIVSTSKSAPAAGGPPLSVIVLKKKIFCERFDQNQFLLKNA
jgi:hypothetical protein